MYGGYKGSEGDRIKVQGVKSGVEGTGFMRVQGTETWG